MNFTCFVCSEKFNLSTEAIKHLKQIHFIKDNTDTISCIVANCGKTFNTFNGLRKHVLKFNHADVIQHLITNIFVHITSKKLFIF